MTPDFSVSAAPQPFRKKRIVCIAALALLFVLGWTRPGWRRTDLSVEIAAINALKGECSDQIPLATTGYAGGAVTRVDGQALYTAVLHGPHDNRGLFTAAMQPAGADWHITAAKITLAEKSLDLRDCPPPPEEPVSDEEDGEDGSVAASDSTGA